MRLADRRRQTDSAFTLLELMIAAVVTAIVFMGLISSITGAFLSTSMANKASEAQATARQMLEEAMELSYGDMLLLDGNSVITTDGLAAKYEVFEVTPGLLMLEVEICRPATPISLAELSDKSKRIQDLEAVGGSRIRFSTLSTGVMARATVTRQTGATGGSSGSGTGGNGGSGSGTGDNGTGGNGLFWY